MIKPDKTSFSPHSNPFRPAGTGVVIHATRSGKPGFAMELAATLNWFANPDSQVSSHWVIGRQGEKVRVIADTAQAWHAGEHNATHFGIELEQGVETDGFTDAQITALVEVCRGYVEDFGIAPVHSPSTLMSGFIGHQETVQGKRAGKTDPGKLFPWQRFIEALSPPRDETLDVVPGRNGWMTLDGYQVLYNAGVPVLRVGGELPGQLAKNYGGSWRWLRGDRPDGLAYWSEEPGD